MAKTSPFSVRAASLMLLVTMMVLSLAPAAPVSAQPAGIPQSRPGLLLADLSFATVSAPDVNTLFDYDGQIIVNDTTSHFLPTGTTGDAFLQTRLWPRGQAFTIGDGQFPYLYRVDLRNAVTSPNAAPSCVSSMVIPFGAPTPIDYNGDGTPEDVFVITQGGMGNAGLETVTTDGTNITLTFKPSVCTGLKQGSGDSSFFVGMTSSKPPQPVTAALYGTDPTGRPVNLEARGPMLAYQSGCTTTLAGPNDIPSPALINFDSAADKTSIADFYHGFYGVGFENALASALTGQPGPVSAPNIAAAGTAASPMVLNFDTEITHVGFFAINTLGIGAQGTAIVKDRNNNVICRKVVDMGPLSSNTFIGFYDPDTQIVRVEFSVMDASQKPAAAQIDDLNFAPSLVTPTEFPHPKTPLGAGGPEVVTRDMNDTHIGITFNLPDPSLWNEPVNNVDYLRFGLPGVELNGSEDGYPDVPVIRRLIAYPDNATLIVSKPSIAIASSIKARLYPSQPPALDAVPEPDPTAWQNPPFTINEQAYSVYQDFPAEPVAVYPLTDKLGKMRDLNLALLTVAAGQYNPKSQDLVIFKSVDVDITFEGGTGMFLTDQSLNVFEPDVDKYYGQVLNSPILSKYVNTNIGSLKTICGTEFYIVTPPALLPAAQALATWKNSKGISTSVVQYAAAPTGIGNTKDQVKAFLQDRYDKCLIRPSYLLIMGDAELVDTWSYSYTNSDLGYATMDGAADYLPDLAYGRIPVDTLDQANTVVNKIIAYEKTPPVLGSFYKNFTFSSYFECCSSTSGNLGNDDRSFIETSEIARSALMAAGKNVQRIYTTDLTNGITPARYRNGAPLPADIGPSSGFAWNGSTTDIVNAFNAGSGLMFHRDHGWPGGWWRPYFDISNQSLLTNGSLTPVVYSVNCASGVWDNELPGSGLAASDVLWSEALLRMNGGAVSIIGDMRNSPTWANSALARGLFDATWSNTDPTYGDGVVHRRLGDILNYAKLYMLAQVYLPQTAGAVTMDQYLTNNELYHVIGDPTLELWTAYPYTITLPKKAVFTRITLPASPAPGNQAAMAGEAMQVEYPVEGATITLLQNGQPVGRGVISGGSVVIPLLVTVDPKVPLVASASLDDSVSTVVSQAQIYMPQLSK